MLVWNRTYHRFDSHPMSERSKRLVYPKLLALAAIYRTDRGHAQLRAYREAMAS